jgi:hypothetical protein
MGVRVRQNVEDGRDDVYVKTRLQGALAARTVGQQRLQAWVIKDSRSPTGYGVLLPGGRLRKPLYLDTHGGPGFKIDSEGRVYFDPGL